MARGKADSGSSGVVIVGGGPVGLTLALLLARHGVASTVLEQNPGPESIGSKALCMQRDVLETLDRVGCTEEMLTNGVTWTLGRTYHGATEVLQIRFADKGRSVFPPFSNIPQEHTQQVMIDRVREAADLITVHYGSPVTAITQDPDGVTVVVDPDHEPEVEPLPPELRPVTRVGRDTGAFETRVRQEDPTQLDPTPGATAPGGTGRAEYRARWVVACDGSRSTLRRLMGLEFPGRTYNDKFLIADVRVRGGGENLQADERRFYFDPPWNPGRQVLVHPQPDDVWRIDWQVPDEFEVAEEEANGGLEARIRKIVGEADYEIVWLSQYKFHQRRLARFRYDRIFFAGDAAHLMSPFGARGLNSGVHDAENLAWKLAFVERGLAGDDLLQTYDDERVAAAAENLRVTGNTMDFLVPGTPLQRLWREGVLRAARYVDEARRLVDSGKLSQPFVYATSPLTTPDPQATTADVWGAQTVPVDGPAVEPGELAPDGPVRVPARPGLGRLRQLFGEGFAVLVFGPEQICRDAAAITEDCELPGQVWRVVPPGSRADRDHHASSDWQVIVDTESVLVDAFRPAGREVWVIRPDGHVAARVAANDPAGLERACHRLRCRPPVPGERPVG